MGILDKIREVFGLTGNSTEENGSDKQKQTKDDNSEQSNEVGEQ